MREGPDYERLVEVLIRVALRILKQDDDNDKGE
jgi:hypothetical protein